MYQLQERDDAFAALQTGSISNTQTPNPLQLKGRIKALLYFHALVMKKPIDVGLNLKTRLFI